MALCRLLRLPVLALVWLMMQVNPVLTGIDDWHEAVRDHAVHLHDAPTLYID
ncbi:hypothetical protein LPH50_00475 [Xylella taiwanensis]|uniref:Uncharacterized protein n=1 Tax=Xylella taiwanensis TaxID=1444770 RepID=Z9JHY2_9GAMM|nr:hypothetical protein [Xylella taiwanensis]EWS77799.1 hypothetical protein AF72_08990 [Xylella taiwanensis]MCD8456719.1 hypothetical protein [Xylella taiwanensis]MCD8459126.1 hypothetical protein [Xylella taiwanensis]MCD8461981.1 hypothetical protein [Xylella taiwanensis]MCD8464217.1 hypothetical protein [Xylella taiwanensis]